MYYLNGEGYENIKIKNKLLQWKSNSFYSFPGMRNQVETQKEWSQLNSVHKDSMHYLPRVGGGGQRTINLTQFRLGFFLPSLDWGGGGVKRPPFPPFLKNFKRYRHEAYTTN